jgi:membrane-bound metal-dependent hydrolase YbcI (DUF457 family)
VSRVPDRAAPSHAQDVHHGSVPAPRPTASGERWPRLARLLITPLTVLLLMRVSVGIDAVRHGWLSRMQWLVVDTTMQTAIALVVILPLLRHRDLRSRPLFWGAIGLAAIVLLDLDHFGAARSLDLNVVMNMSGRPITHSLTFATLCGLLAWAFSRRAAAGWLVFGGMAAHVLHDVWDGGALFLWPLGVTQMPLIADYLARILLASLLAWLAERGR